MDIGFKHGYWQIIGGPIYKGKSVKYWLCECQCGTIRYVRGDSLKSKNRLSCGCLHKKQLALRVKTHGKYKTKTYQMWQNMKGRCRGGSELYDKYYVAKGIMVCPEWDKFENFLHDMGESPKGYSLDRKDPSKNYCKDNCEWVPKKQQARNMSSNKKYTYLGLTLLRADWTKIFGLSSTTILTWEKRYKYSIEDCAERAKKIGKWDGVLK